MEAHVVDPSTIPAGGKPREDWYWDQIETLVQANVNLVSEVEMLKKQQEKHLNIIQAARDGQLKHGKDIIQMGTELNAARKAAANAVQEYIALNER